MLQQLQANQPLGVGKAPALSLPSVLKSDLTLAKQEDFSIASGAAGIL